MPTAMRTVAVSVAALGAVAVSLYIMLDAERGGLADPAYVERCRDLARQAMDISVEAAGAGLDPGDPLDAGAVDAFRAQADDLQGRMDSAGCGENPEKWIYGSFQQEMIETERYIAFLLEENRGNG